MDCGGNCRFNVGHARAWFPEAAWFPARARAANSGVPPVPICAPGRQVAHRLRVDFGVLANIERVQVKAERLHLPQQRVEQQTGKARAPIGVQAVAH